MASAAGTALAAATGSGAMAGDIAAMVGDIAAMVTAGGTATMATVGGIATTATAGGIATMGTVGGIATTGTIATRGLASCRGAALAMRAAARTAPGDRPGGVFAHGAGEACAKGWTARG